MHLTRRLHQRTPADLPAKLCDESAARFFPARVRDVSAQGCKLIVPPSFAAKPGSELRMHVADQSSAVARRQDMRPVRIAWRMALDDHGGYAIGIERLDVAPETRTSTLAA
ncbi:MAG: PilZ domain-containing protein [Planctomycetota bacterium]